MTKCGRRLVSALLVFGAMTFAARRSCGAPAPSVPEAQMHFEAAVGDFMTDVSAMGYWLVPNPDDAAGTAWRLKLSRVDPAAMTRVGARRYSAPALFLDAEDPNPKTIDLQVSFSRGKWKVVQADVLDKSGAKRTIFSRGAQASASKPGHPVEKGPNGVVKGRFIRPKVVVPAGVTPFPIAEQKVYLTDNPNRQVIKATVLTDEYGSYRLTAAPGTYYIQAIGNEYPVVVKPGKTVTQDFYVPPWSTQ